MWTYLQPTRICFGVGVRRTLADVTAGLGSRPVLITDTALKDLPMTAEVLSILGPGCPLFSEVEPNPTITSVDRLAQLVRSEARDVVVALGGGSSLDCAKAACSVAIQGGSARDYHSGGGKLDGRHVPLVAMPTTAGTGSEVTPISVLDDPDKGIKAPLVHDNFFARVALVDPELTLTMPRYVTACTGLDALSHAIEGYWSRNHQPICDAMALRAVGLVFANLPVVLEDAGNIRSREGMSLAALLAGLAFQAPKNAAVHACSFSISAIYHQPHGAACAMTLDHFVKFNAPAMGDRGIALAQAAGFADMEALADGVAGLKELAGLPARLAEIGVTDESLDKLVSASFHPLMNNNPREITPSELRSLYRNML